MSASILSLPGPTGTIEFDAAGLQGTWTEEQYLRLAERTNRLIELIDGRLEALPMPTTEHQILLAWLLKLLDAALGPGALVLPAALPLRLPSGRYREPDILVLLNARDARRGSQAWTGADLVIEIVSPDNPDRDYSDKRADYAIARIGEYWIVDPVQRRVTVLTRRDDAWADDRVFGPGSVASSGPIASFRVDVAALFTAIE
jgi:Uma2 family endonuclease